jgi:hypothetical protein
MISGLIIIVIAAGIGFAFWRWRRREEERNRAAEERMASFIAQAVPATQAVPAAQALPAPPAMPAVDASSMRQQKLLHEAASKAGEAGEAALSIQLYARLLSRYPDSALGGLARTAVEEQKRKLARP